MKPIFRHLIGLFFFVTINFLSLQAQVVWVNNLNDSGPGSFREAVANAFPSDTVKFNVNGTIFISSNEITYSKDLVIWGPGTHLVQLDGANSQRILKITAGSSVIHGVTIANCNNTSLWDGGAIQFTGDTLHLDSTVFSNNKVVRSGGNGIMRGGAVHASGNALRLTNSIFKNNIANGMLINQHGRGYGGAISAEVNFMSVVGSRFEKNGCHSDRTGSNTPVAYGGAIYFRGLQITFETTDFDSNYCRSVNSPGGGGSSNPSCNGGALYANGLGTATADFRLNDCSFSRNIITCSPTDGNLKGGALYLYTPGLNKYIENCTFSENKLGATFSSIMHFYDYEGGAVNIRRLNPAIDSNFIRGCHFTDNYAREGGAITQESCGEMIIEDNVFDGNHAARIGGALFIDRNLLLRRNVFTRNYAQAVGSSNSGGAVAFNTRELVAYENLFHNNYCTANNLTSSEGIGGAMNLSNPNPPAEIYNNSFVGNRADMGGSLHVTGDINLTNNTFLDDSLNSVTGAAGRSVFLFLGTSFFKNNIFSNTVSDPNPHLELGTNFNPQGISLGGNLVRDNFNTSILNQPTDLHNTNPMLSPLANNGGPTMTLALAVNSPASNTGVADVNIVTDQRGYTRDANIDRGAFEYGASSPNAATVVNQPSPASGCIGDSTFFALSASGQSLTYQWYISTDNGQTFAVLNSGPPYTGVNSDSLYLNGIDANMDGYLYYCLINNATSSDTIALNVFALPTANAGANVSICAGQSTTLNASGGGTYNWNNNLGAGQNHTISPVSNTTYTVTVTNTNNCTDTHQVTVTVNAAPTANAGANVSICAGQSTTLNANGGGTYNWNNGLGAGQSHTVSPVSNTTYMVTVTNANNCTDADQVTVTVNAAPIANAGANVSICSGQSTTLNASGGGTYNWNNNLGSGQSHTVSPVSNTTYTVTVTNANNCTDTDQVAVTVNAAPSANAGANVSVCAGQSTTLNASGGGSYNWNNGLGAGQSHTVSPVSSTTYTVTVTNTNNCTDTDQVTVTVNAAPSANAGANVSICVGQSTTLNASGGGTYNWNNGLGAGQSHTVSPVSNTTYTVTVTNANNCTDTDQVTVTVNTAPTANAGANVSICTGQSTTLNASGGGIYNWNTGLGSGQSHTVSPVNSTTYTVTVTNANNCIDTDQVTVTVNPLPPVLASTLTSQICLGDTATLNASGAQTYQWTGGALLSSSGASVMANPTVNSIYTVYGSDANGCSDTSQISVMVNPLPQVSFAGLAPAYCTVDPLVQLIGNPGGGNFSGPGVTGTSFDPAAAGQGNHTIVYNYTDGFGCENFFTQSTVVDICSSVSDQQDDLKIQVFPNPAHALVKVQIDGLGAESVRMNLIDAQGRILSVPNVLYGTNLWQLDLSGLAKGPYLLLVQTQSGTHTQRLIKVE